MYTDRPIIDVSSANDNDPFTLKLALHKNTVVPSLTLSDGNTYTRYW